MSCAPTLPDRARPAKGSPTPSRAGWLALTRFLDDERLCMSNNAAEPEIRAVAPVARTGPSPALELEARAPPSGDAHASAPKQHAACGRVGGPRRRPIRRVLQGIATAQPGGAGLTALKLDEAIASSARTQIPCAFKNRNYTRRWKPKNELLVVQQTQPISGFSRTAIFSGAVSMNPSIFR